MTQDEINLTATVSLTWKKLSATEKLVLVNTCNWPGSSLDDPDLEGSAKYKHLGTKSGVPHSDVIKAVNALAARDLA